MSPEKKLSQLGEFGLIDRIAARVVNSPAVVTGIGDDAAVTALSPGMQLLTSTDMLLEDVHFRLEWHDPYRLGRKSLAVSISDLAAMGAIPRWALLSLALPQQCPIGLVDDFTRGFLSMAAEHGVTLIGGDTCRSAGGLVISVTIMGEQLPDLILRRSGAKPGDDIWVTGTIGDAAMGLLLLEKGRGGMVHEASDPGVRQLLSRLLDPTPRTNAGLILAGSGLVSAMIDVSDGLLADFGHIAEMSGVGGSLQLDSLPISAAFRSAAARLPEFPYQLALCGGEDYELAFTGPAANRKKIIEILKKSSLEAVRVGIVASSPEVTAVFPGGGNFTMQSSGFSHFS